MTQHKWWQEAVIYQIYPRSFADSNGDGIGDLNGITAHLDYLRDLGVNVLWLSPVYQSPNDDNGYDISDYRAIMREFGTMQDFDRLLAEAHKRGLKLLMDLVVNHTSDEHAWFVESRSSRQNPYRDFYIWKDGKNGAEPNNWGSCFSGPAWQKDPETDQYYLHLFSKKQPDLNWANPKVRDAVYDMMCWWGDKGIDGFRMDVASYYAKSNFNDGAVAPGALYGDFSASCLNQPTVHTYLKEMNRRVFAHYDMMSVGETGGVTVPDALKYANLDGSELSMVFQFDHTEGGKRIVGKWTDRKETLPELRACLNKWQLGLSGKAWNSLYWDNHDQPRAVSRFGNDAPMWRVVSAKMLATCLHMMQGTPYIYQGEELGMTNAYFEKLSDYRDLETLNAYREYTENGLATGEEMMRYFKEISRDNARTPMQWDTAPNAGFTTGTPWIAVNKNYLEINAAAEEGDPASVLNYYKALIRLRRQHSIVIDGTFVPLLENDPAVYAFRREQAGAKLWVACNFTADYAPSTLLDGLAGRELISNYQGHKVGILQPYEARVILCEE
jgi:oligo-1,6-glucosidase